LIENFTRPLNIESLRTELATFGNITTFWMDKIRSHCYVTVFLNSF
jgi:hypothetical protein